MFIVHARHLIRPRHLRNPQRSTADRSVAELPAQFKLLAAHTDYAGEREEPGAGVDVQLRRRIEQRWIRRTRLSLRSAAAAHRRRDVHLDPGIANRCGSEIDRNGTRTRNREGDLAIHLTEANPRSGARVLARKRFCWTAPLLRDRPGLPQSG